MCEKRLKKKKRNLHTKWHSNVLIYASDKRRGIDFAFADINSFQIAGIVFSLYSLICSVNPDERG